MKRKVGLSGTFLHGVRLREHIATARTSVVRWRTRQALPPGRYYVHVSTIDLAGVTDCFPRGGTDCTQMWSNVVRVVVPRGSS